MADSISFIDQLKVHGKVGYPHDTKRKSVVDDEDFIDTNDINHEISPTPELVSVKSAITSWNLDPNLANVLIEDSITNFSIVQRLVIPQLMKFHARKCVTPRDLCVSAPTGSGKTLAYALPIMNALIKRKVIRLRALVILPSRELANQVFKVFCRLSNNNDIKLALVTGQKPFDEEQRILSSAMNGDIREEHMNRVINMKLDNSFSNKKYYYDGANTALCDSNTIDVLICTPGRLLDHLYYTNGFTLQHLQFIVLDEADRLLGNAYHDWVRQLIISSNNNFVLSNEKGIVSALVHNGNNDLFNKIPVTLQSPQRLLFSATLTDNPKKLELLGIRNPVIIRAGVSDINSYAEDGEINETSTLFMLPTTLSESMKVCDTATRPLVLISILLEAFAIQEFSGYHINHRNSVITNPVYHSGLCKKGICVSFSPHLLNQHTACASCCKFLMVKLITREMRIYYSEDL